MAEMNLWDLSLPPREEAAFASDPRTVAALRSWDLVATALGVVINLIGMRFSSREQVSAETWRVQQVLAVQVAQALLLLCAPALYSRHRAKICVLNRAARLLVRAEGLWPLAEHSGKPASPTGSMYYRALWKLNHASTSVKGTMLIVLLNPVGPRQLAPAATRAAHPGCPCRCAGPASCLPAACLPCCLPPTAGHCTAQVLTIMHALFHLLPFKLHWRWAAVSAALDVALALPVMACAFALPPVKGLLNVAFAPLWWLPGAPQGEGAREWALAAAALLAAEVLSGEAALRRFGVVA
jgi:hypothetical protein